MSLSGALRCGAIQRSRHQVWGCKIRITLSLVLQTRASMWLLFHDGNAESTIVRDNLLKEALSIYAAVMLWVSGRAKERA